MAKCPACLTDYPSHEKQLPRLNRIVGQVEGIKKMINDRRYCPDILVQFKAVKSALKAVELEILNEHLHSCVVQSFQNPKECDKKIAEIKKLIAGM